MADLETFEITRFGGSTLRFRVANLVDIDGTEITSDGNVTINLYTDSNTSLVTGSVTQDIADQNSYYCDITLPTVTRTRRYVVKASADKNGHTYKDVGVIWVQPF